MNTVNELVILALSLSIAALAVAILQRVLQ
jgi:hypothetical protein